MIFESIGAFLSKLTFFYAYVDNNSSFPKPLDKELENELVEQMSKGDNNAKLRLIEHNMRLVAHIVKKYSSTAEADDLISAGSIGLIKAVNSFDADKNIKLATYASRCIENEILMFLRKTHNIKTEVSIDEPLNTDWDGNELLLSDVLGTDSDEISKDLEDEIDKKLLYEAIEKLSKREKQIIRLRFGLNSDTEKTQKEVADMLGISQSYISRLEKRIISRLKKEIAKLIQ